MKEEVPIGWGERRKLLLSAGLAFALGFAMAAPFFSPSLRSRIQSILIEAEVPVTDYYQAPIELIEARGADTMGRVIALGEVLPPMPPSAARRSTTSPTIN